MLRGDISADFTTYCTTPQYIQISLIVCLFVFITRYLYENDLSVISSWCHVMSCHVMSCHVMSCHVMSCHVMSCHVMSCHVMSCHAMPCHAMPCHAMPCHAMPCHAMPCHAMPCHAMPCHAMPCHAMPCHAMPCHREERGKQPNKMNDRTRYFKCHSQYNKPRIYSRLHVDQRHTRLSVIWVE